MNTRKLAVALFAVTGFAGTDVASAQSSIGASQVTKMFGSSMHDLAPVTNSSPAMLRRNRNDQPGVEMATVAMFTDADGRQTHGIYFARASTYLNGQGPTDNVQGAMVGFTLKQDPSTGLVSAALDPMIPAQFITQNNGSEQRNFQVPTAYSFNNGTAIAIEYTYRPNDRSYRYMMAYNASGQKIMGQTKIYAKTNDDCAMMQDGEGGGPTAFDATDPTHPVSRVFMWYGCNGDGDDDGWGASYTLTTDSATAPTTATWKEVFDVALCQQEERSRGKCTVGTDPNTAICTWTEGDDQPQRDGTWMAAVDITPGKYSGTDRQDSILWKQMIDGRKDATSDGTPTTYSQRAMHERIQMPDASGLLKPTDMIIWRSGDARGNNNDNQKGGTYYRNNMAIMNVTKAGMTYMLPLQDMQKSLSGLDGTHLGIGPAVFGSMDAPMAGLMFIGGSQFGGGYGAQMTAVAFDKTTSTLKKLGDFSGAPLDRHMYSNYLGQNPGNQGRNFSHTIMIPNPFAGTAGNTDKFLELIATNGKDSNQVAKTNPDNSVMDTCYADDDTGHTTPVACARLKLSSYLTILPVAQIGTQPGSGTGGGTGGGTGMGSGATGSGSDTSTDPTDPGVTLGGCSTTNGTTGAGMFLLIGLAAFIRRRR
jgi:MYXO-CTERM domain-containing protein